MFDGRWRGAVDKRTAPVGVWLQSHGITADVLTATGLVTATATAVAVATGHLYLAIVLLTLTGAHDLFDGPVAKAAGTTSVRGAFFDSVTDRVADAVLMGGVSWYLISQGEGHLALLPLAILGVTSIVSYQRAKAEALGLSAKGGLMERAERPWVALCGSGSLPARSLRRPSSVAGRSSPTPGGVSGGSAKRPGVDPRRSPSGSRLVATRSPGAGMHDPAGRSAPRSAPELPGVRPRRPPSVSHLEGARHDPRAVAGAVCRAGRRGLRRTDCLPVV